MALCPTRRQFVALGGLTLLMLGLGVLIPAPAHALELDPPPSVEEILKAIIDELFKVKPANLNGDFLQWLIALPDFIGKPGNGAVDGDLAKLGATTTAIAFAVLTAVATWAVVHYWMSGISFLRGSGTEMLEGITRSIGVALLIIGWPMIFANAVALVNSISAALVDREGLDRLAQMLSGAMGGEKLFQEGVAMILGVVISIAAVVLVLGIAITKVVMSVALAVLFIWMPIAFVIWPVPSLAFITKASIQALTSLLAVQVLWAACLATFLAVGQQVLQWGTRGSVFVDGVAEPFVAIALLTTMMMVTRLVLRLNVSGGMGSGGGGGAGVGHLAAPLASVVSTAAGAPMGPAGFGLGPEFATPGGESAAQQSAHGSGAGGHISEHQGGAGQQGATSQGIGARTVAMPTGASASTAATASGTATAHAGRGAATHATSGGTSGAGAGRPPSAEQSSEAQTAGAGKAGEPGAPGAASPGQGRAPDEQPATGGGGRAPINTVGEQAAGEAGRPADAAAGATSEPGSPGQSQGGDPAPPGAAAPPSASAQPAGQPDGAGGAAPAASSQPAGQPGSAGGAGGRGADGADGSPAAGSSAAGSGAQGAQSGAADVRQGAQEGESASQSAPSGGAAQSDGAGDGRGQPNGSNGSNGATGGAAGAPPSPGGPAGGDAPPVSYDWVAGEFRSSDADSAPSSEAGDPEATEDDPEDVSDVPYTGILEAEDER